MTTQKITTFLFAFFSLVIASFFVFTNQAHAGTVTWVGVSNGSWHSPANWDAGQVPSSTSDVVIASNTQNFVLATSTISFSTLTIGGAANATNTLILSGLISSGGNITLSASGTLSFATTSAQSITGTLLISSGGTLTHERNWTAQTSTINFSAAAVTVNSGGSINVDEKGYNPNSSSAGRGPGAGGNNGAFSGGGGGHGGNGGIDPFGVVARGIGYCTISGPTTVGSSGGGSSSGSSFGAPGGGLISITTTGTTTLNGIIVARGGTSISGTAGGGGAGGGIKIVAPVVTGTPSTFSVAGSAGGSGGGGGGGGGCVYIEYTTSNSVSTTASYYSMAGGARGSSSAEYGGAGLTYIKQVGQTGSIWSTGVITGAETPINESLTIETLSMRTSTIFVSSTKSLAITNNSPFLTTTSGTLRIRSGATTTLSTVGTLNTNGASVTVQTGGALVGASVTSLSVVTSSVIIFNSTSAVSFPLTSISMLGGTMMVNSSVSYPDFALNTLNLSGGAFILTTSTVLTVATTSLNINSSSTVIMGASSTLSQTIETISINNGLLVVSPNIRFSSTTVNTLTVGNGSVSSTMEFSGFSTSTNSFNQASTIVVSSKGLITHSANVSAQSHIVNISATTFTLNSGGHINVDGRGYTATYGTGAGGSSGSFQGAGGAHGGNGGAGAFGVTAGGTRYCTTSSPATIGSGGGNYNSSGGAAGGGLVILSATGTLTISGSLTAKGGIGNSGGGGGGGGGVKIIASVVTGTPQFFNAVGGDASSGGGGGGGGCTYIGYYTSNAVSSTLSYFSVAGGTSSGGGTSGSAGASVILQLNSAPVLSSLSISASSTGSGYVSISVQATDADTNDVKIKTEYKAGTCAAYTGQATTTLLSAVTSTYSGGSLALNNAASDGYQITAIKTTSGANTVYYTWNSISNLPSANGQYCLFVTPNDGTTSGTTVSSTVTLDNTAPTAPGSLSFHSTSTQGFVIRFGASSTDSNFSHYKIFYKAGTSTVTQADTAITSSTDVNLASVTFNSATTTSVASLATSTQYVFNIWVFDTFGNSATATTELVGFTLADVPSSLSQIGQSSNTGIITWSSTNPSTTAFLATNATTGNASGWTTGTLFYDSSLSCGRTFNYSVKARNGDLIETDSTSFGASSSGCPGYSPPLTSSAVEVIIETPVVTSTPIVVPTSTLPIALPTSTPPVVPEVIIKPEPVVPPILPDDGVQNGGVAERFTRLLIINKRDEEVVYLQQLLNKLGFTVAKTGAGSAGKETTMFGRATYNALLGLQKKNRLRAVGRVDEPTRQLLNKLWNEEVAIEEDKPIQEVEGEKITVAPLFTKTLKMGSVDTQVLALQKILNKHGFTVSKTGAGSAGKETTTFAGKTKSALMLLQKKYKVSQTGQVDEKTRAVLNGLAR